MSGTADVIAHYLLRGEKKITLGLGGASARIFHVGNCGAWKRTKSQSSLTFILSMKVTSTLKVCMQVGFPFLS